MPWEDILCSASYLKDNHFLLYSWNHYNSLGLGLTQLYNRNVVLNRKRHGVFKLGNKEFDFKKSDRGFPNKLTLEFLLVDLVNNLNNLSEDTSAIKGNIQKNLCRFDQKRLLKLAKEYGKIGTKYYFEDLINQHAISS